MFTKNILLFSLEDRKENIPQVQLESIWSEGITEL